VKVKWLGHACFLITSDKGLKIITDPYGVIIPILRTDICVCPGYSKENLLKLKPNAILVGKTEVEFVAGKIPSGQVMILEPTL
jgi:hypothetical protein